MSHNTQTQPADCDRTTRLTDYTLTDRVKKYFGDGLSNFVEKENAWHFTTKQTSVECDYNFVHDDIEYTIHFVFPDVYPFSPPIAYLTPIVHDSSLRIAQNDGRLQMDILETGFSPAVKLTHVVDYLKAYLSEL